MLAGVHPLLDADGLEVGAPQVLQQVVVVAQHLVVQTAVGEAEGHGGLVGEGDAHGGGSSVIVIPVVPFGVVDEPRLVVEAVGEMVDDEWQHVVVGGDDGEIGAVLGLLEADELFHPQYNLIYLNVVNILIL